MTTDTYTLKEYSNRLNHIRNSIKNVHLPLIVRLNKKAAEILVELKKEYQLNDNTSLEAVFQH